MQEVMATIRTLTSKMQTASVILISGIPSSKLLQQVNYFENKLINILADNMSVTNNLSFEAGEDGSFKSCKSKTGDNDDGVVYKSKKDFNNLPKIQVSSLD